MKTLRNAINALFQKGLETEELESLLQKLQDDGFISLTGGKLAYHLPD